jgi:CMP-N-acetylneuraminic acid synthetase
MTTLALVPARGGSERLPGKNTARLCGITLVELAVLKLMTLKASGADLEVRVSTDSPDIAGLFPKHICPRLRPPELATATASSWDVVRYEMKQAQCDSVLLLQCTSPFLSVLDIGKLLSHADNYRMLAAGGEPCGAWYCRDLQHAGEPQEFTPIELENHLRGLDIDTADDWVIAKYLHKHNGWLL